MFVCGTPFVSVVVVVFVVVVTVVAITCIFSCHLKKSYLTLYIQGVPGGMCQTSGGYSLC